MTEQSEAEPRPSGYQIEHLCWIEELLEPAQEFDALIVTRLGVDEDEEGREVRTWPHYVPRLIQAYRVKCGRWHHGHMSWSQRANDVHLRSTGGVHGIATPQAAEVLQPQHGSASLFAHRARGGHR